MIQVFGLGESGLKIQIDIQPNPQSVASNKVVPLDHRPSWKVGKNPFIAGLQKKTPPNANAVQPQQFMNGYGTPGREVIYAYGELEDVQGVVHLLLPPGKKFEHLGVKIQYVGRVDMVSTSIICLKTYDAIICQLYAHVGGIFRFFSHMQFMMGDRIMTSLVLPKSSSRPVRFTKVKHLSHSTLEQMRSHMNRIMAATSPFVIL